MLTTIQELFFKNKSARQTIAKNVFWLTITMVLSSITSIFISIWLARHFGPSDYGRWAFVLSFTSFFSVFIEFGFETFIVREIARDKGKTPFYIDNIIFIKTALSVVTLAAMFGAIYFLSHDAVIIVLVYILGPYIIFSSFNTFFLAIFRANEMMQYETLCYLINGIALIVLVSFFLLKGNSITHVGYAYMISSILACGVAVFFLRRYFSKFVLRIDISLCKKILIDSWPYTFGSIISSLAMIDSVILGILTSSEQVGWYSAAYKIPLFAQMGGLIIWRSFFPKLSQKHGEGAESTKKIVGTLAQIMHFLAWPMAFGGTILAPHIITFLFGQKYAPATLAFQLLIWSMAIGFLVSIYQEPIKASNHPKVYLYGVLGGSIMSITLDFMLIPHFGLYGAAFAAFITQVLLMGYMRVQFSHIAHAYVGIIRYTIIPVASSAVMALVIYFYLMHLPVLVAVLAGGLVYLLSYYLFSLIKNKFLFRTISL